MVSQVDPAAATATCGIGQAAAAPSTSGQVKYHGRATGASTTAASKAIAAPRIAVAPPARERHHSHVTTPARTTQPAVRNTSTRLADSTAPAILPSAVGMDNHGSSTEFPPSAWIQPRSTPATTVHTPNVTTTMDTDITNTTR